MNITMLYIRTSWDQLWLQLGQLEGVEVEKELLGVVEQ